MRLLSVTKNGSTVKEALEKATSSINDELGNVPGSINGLETEINVGLSGAKVQLFLTVDDKKVCSKRIFWVNEGGTSEAEALSLAKENLNLRMGKFSGEIADFHFQFISPPLPKRVYVTIIIATNEKVPEKVKNLSTEERRARLNHIINLLGNEAGAINISKTAKTFDVTRNVIYRDLEKLGFER